MTIKPDSVNVLGVSYRVEYLDSPLDVDSAKREALWGSIDYWERVIRIYDNGRSIKDIWVSLLHEILHGIASVLKLKVLNDDEDTIDFLALALMDVFFRNGWLKDENGV